MSTMPVSRKKLLERLRDKEYRDFFVSETNRRLIAEQIREMRDDRGWTQEELARASGKVQETISQLENPNSGRPTLTTLQRLASAFDVALDVRFVSFGELAERLDRLSPEELAVPGFHHELNMVESTPQSAYVNDTVGHVSLIIAANSTTTTKDSRIVIKDAKSTIIPIAPYLRRTTSDANDLNHTDSTAAAVKEVIYARA